MGVVTDITFKIFCSRQRISIFGVFMPATIPESLSPALPAVLCRLSVGHETERLAKPTEEGRTHRWKAFVRPPTGFPDFTDRSFIKKVTFQLHESFKKPRRNVKKPPFGMQLVCDVNGSLYFRSGGDRVWLLRTAHNHPVQRSGKNLHYNL